MMPSKDRNEASTPETARLISRQIRRAENARFLRGLPGFELQRELPKELRDLLCELQETESASSHRDRRPQENYR